LRDSDQVFLAQQKSQCLHALSLMPVPELVA
jgi:hypothetical protein